MHYGGAFFLFGFCCACLGFRACGCRYGDGCGGRCAEVCLALAGADGRGKDLFEALGGGDGFDGFEILLVIGIRIRFAIDGGECGEVVP